MIFIIGKTLRSFFSHLTNQISGFVVTWMILNVLALRVEELKRRKGTFGHLETSGHRGVIDGKNRRKENFSAYAMALYGMGSIQTLRV